MVFIFSQYLCHTHTVRWVVRYFAQRQDASYVHVRLFFVSAQIFSATLWNRSVSTHTFQLTYMHADKHTRERNRAKHNKPAQASKEEAKEKEKKTESVFIITHGTHPFVERKHYHRLFHRLHPFSRSGFQDTINTNTNTNTYHLCNRNRVNASEKLMLALTISSIRWLCL